LPKECATYAC